MSAVRPGAGVPSLGIHEGQQASSGQSGASLLTNPPQEILDVHAIEDLGEIRDPEVEAYANVGASISLPELA